MVAPFIHLCSKTSPLSSMDPPFAARVSGHAWSQDKWPVPLHGYSLKPTIPAQYWHVEQEQAAESVHNDFKVDWAIFCSQPPDNLFTEEKGGKPDVSNYRLKVLCTASRVPAGVMSLAVLKENLAGCVKSHLLILSILFPYDSHLCWGC